MKNYRILEIAQEDVEELRMKNLELVLEKSEIVSMEYIEKEARDKLRYSGEGKCFL
jgi:cell division protein FtsB